MVRGDFVVENVLGVNGIGAENPVIDDIVAKVECHQRAVLYVRAGDKGASRRRPCVWLYAGVNLGRRKAATPSNIGDPPESD